MRGGAAVGVDPFLFSGGSSSGGRVLGMAYFSRALYTRCMALNGETKSEITEAGMGIVLSANLVNKDNGDKVNEVNLFVCRELRNNTFFVRLYSQPQN